MKQTQVSRVECTNGDIHLILKEFGINLCAMNGEKFETAKIKEIMKEEAFKPLFLMRN